MKPAPRTTPAQTLDSLLLCLEAGDDWIFAASGLLLN